MNRLLTLFIYLYVPLSLLCLPGSPGAQEKTVRELFTEAYTFFSQNRLAEAESLFVKTLNRGSPLEDYSLYFLGEIFLSRGDADSAGRYFGQVKQKFPLSVWAPRAELQFAKIMLAAKDYAAARERLYEIRNTAPPREIADEALFLLGQLHETMGELTQAYSVYQELRRSSPLSSWSPMARKEVNRLREEQPQLFGLTRVEALLHEGELLARERQYEEAERVYRTLVDLAPRGPLRPRFLMGLANVLRAARKREEAIPVLTEIVEKYPGSSQGPNALYRLAEIYWNRDENLKALDYFKQLRDRYPKSSFNDLAHIASARIYESLGKPGDALRLYQDFAKRFPDSPMREETQWRSAWIHYLQGDNDRAYAAFHRLAAVKGEGRYKTGALYWQARTVQRLGRSDEAKQIFFQILNAPEESYYKGPAARWLEKMGAAVEEKKTTSSNLFPETVPPSSPDSSFHLSRAQELAEISLNQLAVTELDEIRNSSNDDLPTKFTLIREYARNGAYGRSVALANQIPSPSDELNRYRYPLAFWETIQKITEERSLDPYLVVALIRQESMFDPKALSPASAYGLMQLLPSTAVRAAIQLGLSPPQPQKLYEPELNLNLGTLHLKELLQLYSNNVIKAIAAYNAGENAVARWEKQIMAEDEDEFIERIPYGETRLYVKLVLRNHRIYQKIYNSHR